MSKLLRTNKTRPCPVCDKTNGNCRITEDDLILCMTFPDGNGNNPDYRFVKSIEGTYPGGVHALRTDNDFDREAWLQKQEEREAREREIERQRLEKCLTPAQRDSEIKSILNQLTLSNGHRQYLKERGVPDRIIGNCRSVTKGNYGHELSNPVHINLPGVWKNGKGLSILHSGILVPIPNHIGQFIGLRLHDETKTQDSKYKWLTSAKRGTKPNLPNGELPAATHYPDKVTKPQAIGLCEGMEWKSAAAANRLGFPVMGFSGHGGIPNSPQQIQALLDHTGATEIIIIPDDNCLINKGVNKSLTTAIEYWEGKGYTVKIAWWGQTHKGIGDIDEISPDLAIEFIPPNNFIQYAPPRQNTPSLFADLLESVSKKVKPVGFGSVQRIGDKINREDRAAETNNAIKNGFDVLDCSFPGEGKSHSVSDIKNPFGGKTWYVYSDHRNPTVARIADDFADLDPRHKYGMKIDENGKQRPIKKGDFTSDKISYGNCIRADLFPKLNDLGYSPNDGGSENPICKTCPKHDVCGIAEDMYRFKRRETLEKNKIRAHLESLPRDFDYSRDIAIIDEASKLIKPTKTISATKEDLILDADRYREFLTSDQWQELDNWVQAFKKLFITAKHFGDRHDEVIPNLPALSDELKSAINDVDFSYTHIFPDTHEATIKGNEEVFKGLSAKERRKLKRQMHRANQALRSYQNEETETNLELLPPNLIAHIVNGAIIRVKKSGLSLTINRLDDIPLKQFASVVYLEATANPETLRLTSGRDKPIKFIRSEGDYPLENLTINQVFTSGIGSISSPTPNGIRNIKAIKEAIEAQHGEMPFLTHKGWSTHFPDLSYYWHRDSRGSNDFIGLDAMIAAGLPCPNLGAIEDEYLAIRGNLDGFDEHFTRLVNEEILQWVGRLRPTRAPDKNFNLFLISREWDLTWLESYGATVHRIPGYRLAPETSTAQEIARAEILEVVLDFHRRGTTPKLIDVSEALDKTDKAIRKTLKAWNVDLASLYKFIDDSTKASSTLSINNTIREGTTNNRTKDKSVGEPPPSPVEYSEVWGFAMKLTREQLLEEAGRAMADGGIDGLMRSLADYPPAFRAKMMAAVALEHGQVA